MPLKLNGETYYWTAEACQTAGTTKNTFLRWVKEQRFPDIERRDRRGWRLFTEDDLERLKVEVNRVHIGGIAESVEIGSHFEDNGQQGKFQPSTRD